MKHADRATEMLRHSPMTRFELECKLGISQQRVSEVLRVLGAYVVGQEPAPGKGRPAPIYAIGEPEAERLSIGRVSSVWQLGAQS